MMTRFLRALKALDIEERILCAAALASAAGVMLPWLSREFDNRLLTFAGYSFLTSLLGIAILALHLFVAAVTLLPAFSLPLPFRRRLVPLLRLIASSQALVLVLASLSVLVLSTVEFSRTEVRYGVYVSLLGSVLTTFYASLKWQEYKRREVQNFFHHPEELAPVAQSRDSVLPPPPPPEPPPPLKPEDHSPSRAKPAGLRRPLS